MEFNKIKEEIKKIEPDTTRTDNESYFEVVIGSARLEEMVRALEAIFRAPAWPSKNKVKIPKDVEKLIKNAGGLRKGQTLYYTAQEGHSVFVMLWPWQDGQRITVKMSKV